MPFQLRSSGLALGLLLAATPAIADERETWRLVVADHDTPVVRVFDLEGGELDSFATRGPASLAVGPTGGIVYAIQTDAGVVQAVDSGIAIEDHGDHADLHVDPPQLLESRMEGERPVHFAVHDGAIAVFFDGEGVARIYTERGLAEGRPPRLIETAAPHHGVAAVVGAHVLVSVPHAQDPSKLPVGLRVLDSQDAPVGADHACPELHGEAASGAMMAFACATGLLLVEPTAQAPSIRHLPYAAELPEGKSTTLLGGAGIQYFVGNYGDDAVVVVDPAEESFTLIPLPSRRVHFAVDSARPQFLHVLTEDGQLHRIDVLAGAIADSIQVTAPYSMDGHWSDPRPRVAVAGDTAVVTDPLDGVLHLIATDPLAEVRTVAVGGKPYKVVAVGGRGAAH